MLEIEFAQVSHPGSVRDHNEDYLGYVQPSSTEETRSHGWLFALADGVGGQDCGEVASSLAVDALLAGFRKANGSEPLTALLPRLIQTANTQVFEAGLSAAASRAPMATTIVACALRFDRVTVAHAGDSRCYLVRQGYAVPLTRDHTFSNEQVRLGLVTSREAAKAETSHVLSRALGNEMFLTVDTSEHQIFAGDVLVLCSDGLHHSVGADDIARLTADQPALDRTANDLIALANERDGSDNISVQLIRVRSVERVGIYRGRQYKIQ
jgi:serine/threonine protein phosphatase PrpC